MKYEQIKVIDFSKGIKSKEVYGNDVALQEQTERERLTIAGSGVSYGLELSIDAFLLSVENGTLIDIDGKEQFINKQKFEIEKPILTIKIEKVFSNEDGVIELADIPYATNRNGPSEHETIENSGITVKYEGTTELLQLSRIENKTLYTNAKDKSKAIIVEYNKTDDRIDTIYVNDKNELTICSGVTSNTPSAYKPSNCKYILGFIRINHDWVDKVTNTRKAKATIIHEFNNRRTVYTDKNNVLYLCGVPYDSLVKIYFDEPKIPRENMFWYDSDSNKLNVWRRTDNFMFTDVYTYTSSDVNNPQKFRTSVGYMQEQLSVYLEDFNVSGDISTWSKLSSNDIIYCSDLEDSEIGILESKEFKIVPKLLKGARIKYTINRYDDSFYWVSINDTSFVSAFEYKMWCPNSDGTGFLNYQQGLNTGELKPERKNHDLKTFLFYEDEMHLRFTPYKNELSVMIDQIYLYRDQFVEITVEDILKDNELINMAVNNYGYSLSQLNEMSVNYKELGIGFKLTHELDAPAYIQVDVEHRVNDSILKNKLQRSATFVKSETIVCENITTVENSLTVFPTLVPYKYREEQLEVFKNGIRLRKELVTEITESAILGASCKSFSIMNKNLKNKDEITYKITSNVFSYDHITTAIQEENKELYEKIRKIEAAIGLEQ